MTAETATTHNCHAHFGLHEIPCPYRCNEFCLRQQPQRGNDRIAELERANAALAEQLAEARKDAERWQWTRENMAITLLTYFFGNGCVNRTLKEVESQIDAALSAREGKS